MEKNEEYKDIIRKFIITIRGEVSQASMSEKLGFSFNVVNRWESGKRSLYWEDFVAIGKCENWDITGVLRNITGFIYDDPVRSESIFENILSIESNALVLTNLFSYQKLKRLESGSSKLTFNDFLIVIDTIFGRVDRFLKNFADLSFDPGLQESYECSKSYLELNSADPTLGALRCAIDLASYRALPEHSSEFLGKLLGMSISDVDLRLRVLEGTGIIEFDGTYYITPKDFVDTGSRTPEDSTRIGNNEGYAN